MIRGIKQLRSDDQKTDQCVVEHPNEADEQEQRGHSCVRRSIQFERFSRRIGGTKRRILPRAKDCGTVGLQSPNLVSRRVVVFQHFAGD